MEALAIVEGSDSISVRHPVETAVSAREAAQEILRNIIFLSLFVSAISDGPAAKIEQHGLDPAVGLPSRRGHRPTVSQHKSAVRLEGLEPFPRFPTSSTPRSRSEDTGPGTALHCHPTP